MVNQESGESFGCRILVFKGLCIKSNINMGSTQNCKSFKDHFYFLACTIAIQRTLSAFGQSTRDRIGRFYPSGQQILIRCDVSDGGKMNTHVFVVVRVFMNVSGSLRKNIHLGVILPSRLSCPFPAMGLLHTQRNDAVQLTKKHGVETEHLT